MIHFHTANPLGCQEHGAMDTALQEVIVGGRHVNCADKAVGYVTASCSQYTHAALMSGLEIQEVHNHTYPSHYVSKEKGMQHVVLYCDI